jgi:hypothetical protein
MRWTTMVAALCLAAAVCAATPPSPQPSQSPEAPPAPASAASPPPPPLPRAGEDPGDGALLYATHCNGCHTAQVHWRDGKRVANWAGLLAEVRRWQRSAGLTWSDDDVVAVARHLNGLYYHLPEPGRVAWRSLR